MDANAGVGLGETWQFRRPLQSSEEESWYCARICHCLNPAAAPNHNCNIPIFREVFPLEEGGDIAYDSPSHKSHKIACSPKERYE